MSTGLATPPPPRTTRGLPRPFVALCVLIGVFVGAYAVVTLLSVTTASTEHVRRTYQAVEELRIDVGSGDVEIVGERRGDVLVDAEIQRGMWRGAWRPETNLLRDDARLDAMSGCSFWAQIGVSDCGASFTIRVPHDTRVFVESSSGDATVTGVEGAVLFDASSGDMRGVDLAGPLTISTSSGDIEVERHRGSAIDASSS
ncbi:MAG TPA: hypothetical protein VK506_09890, partial [Conexibacter sp.]|nr:hypothetical protein [Conexibacter sp.]